jgi:hypothetical protein
MLLRTVGDRTVRQQRGDGVGAFLHAFKCGRLRCPSGVKALFPPRQPRQSVLHVV